MDASPKPQPSISSSNRPYFEAARAGRLVIQRCGRCDRYIFTPRDVCPQCLDSSSLTWEAATGTGHVHSWCIVHRPHHESFYAETPIVFAAIRLEEGPIMLSEVKTDCLEDVKIGDRVSVSFQSIGNDTWVPVWTHHQRS